MQQFVEDDSVLKLVVCDSRSIIKVTFGGANATRPEEMIDPEEFVGVKSHRAKGKRLTTFDVASVEFLVGVKPEPESPQATEEDTEEDVQDEEPMTTIRVEGDSEVEIVSGEDDDDESLNPHAEQLNLF
jgi:topoisomerase-4 subunit A